MKTVSFASEIININKKRPDHPVLVDRQGSRTTKWSEFYDAMCRVAAYAERENIHGVVPIWMDRGLEAFSSILGLSLAGVGVAPLSITTPESRCELISSQVGNPVWTEETWRQAMKCEPDYSAAQKERIADPAYVVFTSGSTGTPKGVQLGNQAIIAEMKRMAGPDYYDMHEGERTLQHASMSFVALVMDIMSPLYAGCLIYVFPEEAKGDVRAMTDYINRYGINHTFMSPQLYRMFEGAPSLKSIITGSDKVVNIGPKGHRLIACYGMSETAGCSFHYEVKEATEYSPIGEPSPEFECYVVDEDGNLADEGEICVSGAIANGYLNLPEQTAAAFTPNPWAKDSEHAVLLHTGDMVRRDEKLGLLYLNRMDNMIKINGQRVEPGEIEQKMTEIDGIRTAIVKGFTDEHTRTILCGYYVADADANVDEDEIKRSLSASLPHYMVPSVFVKLDKVPLNANGKLDRKSLQLPDLSQFLEEYEAPVGEKEQMLCQTFANVLKLEKVGRNDDFFRIGGDSIAALQVVKECEMLGISTGDIFAGRTPKSIAIFAEKSEKSVYENLPEAAERSKLTDSQMGILLECGLFEGSTKYNIPMHLTFERKANMDAALVKAAMDRVIKNHPALYAKIHQENDEFYMVRSDFPQEGICQVSEIPDANETTIAQIAKDVVVPIAPGKDPLITANAYLTNKQVHIFWNMHHVISDGSSVAIMVKELQTALSGQDLQPEAVDAFALYEAQCRLKATSARAAANTYYENLLSGVEIDSNLIPDHGSNGADGTPGAVITAQLPAASIQKFLEQTGFTENTFFMGVYGYVLAKMTGQSESLFGAAENGRDSAILGGTVSMLVKTLPVVLKIDEEKTGTELLAGLQSQFFATMRNDSVGFNELANAYGIRSDVMFVYQSDMLSGAKANANDAKTVEIQMEPLPAGEALSNLSFMVLKKNDAYQLRVEYRMDLYEAYTINRLIELYKKTAEAFTSDKALKEIELISENDRAFLDRENELACCLPLAGQKTVLDLFADSVKKHPEKTAIISGGRSYTYAMVDEISNRIAWHLAGQGIGSGNVVSVLIPRCEYMLIASLGVLKSGAAYQPLDPSYPPERLTFMTKDAQSALLIKDRKFENLLPDFEESILYTDEIENLAADEKPLPQPSPEDMFVLLYTSGTTGTPKGVMLTHGNLAAFAYAQAVNRSLSEDSIVAQYASYGFDAHLHDLFPAIRMGCTITVIPDEIRLDLEGIKEFCEASHVTHLFMTTQVARQFAICYCKVKYLQVLDTGGEKLVALDPPKGYKLINFYGPSEGTVSSTKFDVDRYYADIPIGKASVNYRVFIADAYGRRVPVGVPGELIQCGPQVGRGYLGRPDLTEKVFVPNTYENYSAGYERCYKTGDIVRFVQDGNIEFIGRRDHQVKIRGFRIELGEVEKAILDFPNIKQATVTVLESETSKNLCAYIVSDETVDIQELNRFIAETHPAYMVPAVTMQIDALPLTANGKVDKKKLPAPTLAMEDAKKPENELQQQIFDCVAEAVGMDEFGIDTDMFMAGLSSIGSIRLCTLLADAFDMSVKLRDLKRCQTVLGLEQFIREEKGMADEAQASAEASAADENENENAVEYGPAFPITKTMEGIFTECLQRPESTIYNIPWLIKLGAGIDAARLKNAIAQAVEAHSCMKAELFTDENGTVCQHLRLNAPFTPDEVKELHLSGADAIDSSLVTPFALMNGRLFEISLIHAEGLYLFINIHHIISDGTSMGIFVKDIERAYAGEALQAETFTGFDVAAEEKKSRTKAELAAEKEYYEELLAGTDKDFLLLPDRMPGAPEGSGTFNAAQVEADANAIAAFCEGHKISMNAYFVSVFGTVLARYAGTEYSVFNTVYNGRNDSRVRNTNAMLVKTLPVVCYTDKDLVSDLTKEISAQLMDSMSNDLYSYAEITREFGVKNDVMFVFQGDSFVWNSFCGQEAEEIVLSLSESKAPMTLQVIIQDGKLVYELEYDPKRFTEKMAKAFVMAFDQAAAMFARVEKLKDVTLLSQSEEAEMEKHNATEMPYDKERTIADFFLESVAAYPDNVCVEYHGHKYTYEKVDELTAKLSYFLMQKGIGRGDIVGILIHRDENMVIGAHGVIRSGAAYLGLDPTYPTERLEFMMKDSGASCLIADRSLIDLLPGYDGTVIYTDEIEALPMPQKAELEAFAKEEKHCITPEDTAILIYSSGTTGLPKGSILRHRNIVCFYHNYTADVGIQVGTHVATYASFGFDGGAMDVFCVPMAGASLYVIPDEIRLDLTALEKFYVKNEINSGFMTTQVGCMFVAATRCKSLKKFMVGGEKLIPVVGPSWLTFMNGYGPSECMCYVNRYDVKNTGSLQPIGKVSRNTKEYIIDANGNRQPYGACGELCIAGGQVGKGYLNRPEKTAEAFVKNPFSNDPDYEILYRTGDIVRMLPDGNYDFVGRRDGQVKIRGFRIELSEVEQQIRKFPGVTNVVVRAFDNPSGGKFMAAYVVTEGALDQEELRDFISREKPDYMVPAVIMQLDEIPLTSNGKVDGKKLPAPKLGTLSKGTEPANEVEETICGIFGDVVGIDKVYADDDFFKIGGSSISAIQVVVKCEQAGFPVVYKNLFANPTAQKLAAFIQSGKTKDVSATDLDAKEEFDSSALAYNVLSNLPNIRNDGVGDVLLTGVTGFLGSHIYKELMDSTSSKVICLVRGKTDLPAKTRFEAMMTYYFEDWFKDVMWQRTTIIDGELEDEEVIEQLKNEHFDTIINSAANVKHFAVENELLSSNFSGVENLIELARESGAKLIQISSLSVCGESVNGSVPDGYVFKESDLNIGQSLENQYIYTKYLGERAVIDAISKKQIRGKVIRLGNLMARIDDSQFQVNAGQNGFLRFYLGFAKLGCFPVDMLDAEIEFSPIDRVARAVVLLSGTPDEFTVFHAKNSNSIHYAYLLYAIQKAGYPIEIVEGREFEERLKLALENGENAQQLGGLLAYRNSVEEAVSDGAQHTGDEDISAASKKRIKVETSTTFTTKALYRLGFGWPLVSMEYLKKMVQMLIEFDFFEL